MKVVFAIAGTALKWALAAAIGSAVLYGFVQGSAFCQHNVCEDRVGSS